MTLIVAEVILTAVVAFIASCVALILRHYDRRQNELHELVENIRSFLSTTSKDAGILAERVASNTKDIVEINSTIKSICEDNKAILKTVREQNTTIERILSDIKQDNAVQETRISVLEKFVEELKEEFLLLKNK